jgi:transcriptional regulator with XRE-family HTH domain
MNDERENEADDGKCPIDRDALRVGMSKMGEKGWTDEDLAKAADISARTIGRYRKAGRAPEDAVKSIANALGIPLNELSRGALPYIRQPPNKPEKRTHKVLIHINASIEKMDLVAKDTHKALLRKVIGATTEIKDEGVTSGSCIFTLVMTEADILRLLAALMDNDLDMLQITKIDFGDCGWLITMIAVLQYNKVLSDKSHAENRIYQLWTLNRITGVEWDDLLQLRVLENGLGLKTDKCKFCGSMD